MIFSTEFIGLKKSELIFTSLFASLFILLHLFGNSNFILDEISHITISEASTNGIDISKRIKLFYTVLFGFTILLIGLYLLQSKVARYTQFSLNQWLFLKNGAGIGSVLILAHLYGIEFLSVIQLVAFILCACYVLFLLQQQKIIPQYYVQPTLLLRLLVLSLIVNGIVLFLTNSTDEIIKNGITSFALVFTAFIALHYVLNRFFKIESNSFFTRLLPLFLVPPLIFFSVEFLFYQKIETGINTSYKSVFIGLIAGCLIVWNTYLSIKKSHIPTQKLFSYFFIPSAIATFVLLIDFLPFMEQPHELFELANPAVSQLRIFKFHEIPFVDFLSSHMFSEQWYGIIYHLIFGYSGTLEFMIYEFFNSIVLYFIIYFFLKKLFRSDLIAFVFILTFPLVPELFNTYLFMGIIAFFHIDKLAANQSVKNYFLLFLILSAICFWRLDTGVATVSAVVFFIPIILFTQTEKIKIPNLLKSTVLFSALVISILFVLALLTSREYIFENISIALHYFSGGQAHGLSSLAYEFNQQYFLHHVIFPLLSIGLIILASVRLRSNPSRNEKFLLSATLFLLLIYIFNFQRGLVRHGFMEKQDFYLISTLFLGISLFVISLIQQKGKNAVFLQLFLIGFFSIFGLKYYSIGKDRTTFNTFLEKSSIANLDNQFNEKFEGRILNTSPFADENHTDFKMFLDENLTEQQTFYDFSNSPMLYYYCQREVPSYFCQNLQNTIDEYLQNEQLNQLDTAKIPVVIYSNYPESWWDATDGIHNAMRQNMIIEFIHKNYQPYQIINNRAIWISKSKKIVSRDALKAQAIPKAKTYQYGQIARFLNTYYNENINDKIVLLKNVEVNPTSDQFIEFNIGQEIRNKERVLIKVELGQVNWDDQFKIDVFNDSIYLGTTYFGITPNQLHYIVPISNHWGWFNTSVSHIRVPKNEAFSIGALNFYQDIRNEY